MHDLTITPQGHLLVRETPLEPPDRKPSKALLEAYGESPARGMLYSASEEMEAVLPPSFEFARSIARLYLTNLCKAATAEPGEPIPELPPPGGRPRTGDPPSPSDDRAGVSDAGSPFELVARPRFVSPGAKSKSTPAERKAICGSATPSGDSSAA